MRDDEVFAEVEMFLKLLDQEASDPVDTRVLEAALDRLAVAATSCADSFDEREFPEPPATDYRSNRVQVAACFPTLGYYNDVLEVNAPPEEARLSIGDALDDLVDIQGEMLEMRWRYLNNSPTDAVWHFKLTFRSHWGAHLRRLQLYLLDM